MYTKFGFVLTKCKQLSTMNDNPSYIVKDVLEKKTSLVIIVTHDGLYSESIKDIKEYRGILGVNGQWKPPAYTLNFELARKTGKQTINLEHLLTLLSKISISGKIKDPGPEEVFTLQMKIKNLDGPLARRQLGTLLTTVSDIAEIIQDETKSTEPVPGAVAAMYKNPMLPYVHPLGPDMLDFLRTVDCKSWFKTCLESILVDDPLVIRATGKLTQQVIMHTLATYCEGCGRSLGQAKAALQWQQIDVPDILCMPEGILGLRQLTGLVKHYSWAEEPIVCFVSDQEEFPRELAPVLRFYPFEVPLPLLIRAGLKYCGSSSRIGRLSIGEQKKVQNEVMKALEIYGQQPGENILIKLIKYTIHRIRHQDLKLESTLGYLFRLLNE